MVMIENKIIEFCGYETIEKENQNLAPRGQGNAP